MHTNAKKALESFLDEDVGSGDITSKLLPNRDISASIITRQNGVVAGVRHVREIFASRGCKVRILKKDKSKIRSNEKIMIVHGPAYAILSCERTALNLLARMSGIATQTHRAVEIIKKANPQVELYSTRKTAPGLRIFDKEAVEMGGGKKHRMSLDEMIMIKDNHIAIAESLQELIRLAKQHHKKIEVEVENLEDAITAAKMGVSTIMLDNIPPRKISRIIKVLTRLNLRNKVKIEGSGGIDMTNVGSYAKSGLDIISMGKITSSVQALDLSLEVNL